MASATKKKKTIVESRAASVFPFVWRRGITASHTATVWDGMGSVRPQFEDATLADRDAPVPVKREGGKSVMREGTGTNREREREIVTPN